MTSTRHHQYRPPNGAGYNAGYSEGHEGGTDYEDEEEEEEELDVGGASVQGDQESMGWGQSLGGEQGAGEERADAGLSINESSATAPLNEVSEPASSQVTKLKPTSKAKLNSGNSSSKRMTRSSVKAKPSETEKDVPVAADHGEGGASAGTVASAVVSVRRRPKRATAAAAEAAGWEIREDSSEEYGVEDEPTPQKQVVVEVQRRSRASRRASSRGKGGAAAELEADAAAKAEAEEDAAEAAVKPESWESDDGEMENVADCAKPGCESDGVLVLCDNCAGATHLECADPPMVE